MDLIKRVVKAIFNEVTKPESFAIGEEFEKYLREYIFPINEYDLIHKTHDYISNRDDYIETSLEPDFEFCSIKNNKEFMVEAKYRSYFDKDTCYLVQEISIRKIFWDK